MADLSRSMPTVARLYTQGRYRRASVKPGPGRALVLREDAEREAREAYAAGVHASRTERDHLHTEYPADIDIANNGEVLS